MARKRKQPAPELFDVYAPDTSLAVKEYGGGQEGVFETYGEDLKTVMSVHSKTPQRVWTLIDGPSDMVWVNGYRFVNRQLYAITTVDGKPEEVFSF
jgi:hypothetical protein